MPPASLTALMPRDPSDPAPENTMAKLLPAFRGERAEEEIDRRPLPARLVELGDRQMMVGRTQLPVGRNNIDVARLHGREAGDLRHRHPRPGGENAGKFALARGIKMHNDNESRVDVVWETFEKHLQGVDAAGGGADANRREALGL